MDTKTREVYNSLMELPDNNYCFECGQSSDQWSSVNNGIFLCGNCSGIHRTFGVNYSFVRSFSKDSWSDLQLRLMQQGGNRKLKQFFEYYQMPKDAPMDFKYKTKAGFYYRELLKALAEGKDAPIAPPQVEGLELIGNITPPTMINTGSGGNGSNESNGTDFGFSFSSLKNKVTGVVTEAGKMTKQVVQKVGDKVTDPEFKQQVKDMGSKIATGTKSAAETVISKGKEIGKDIPGIAGQTASTIKQGWTSAISFFQNKTSSSDNKIIVDHGTHQEYFTGITGAGPAKPKAQVSTGRNINNLNDNRRLSQSPDINRISELKKFTNINPNPNPILPGYKPPIIEKEPCTLPDYKYKDKQYWNPSQTQNLISDEKRQSIRNQNSTNPDPILKKMTQYNDVDTRPSGVGGIFQTRLNDTIPTNEKLTRQNQNPLDRFSAPSMNGLIITKPEKSQGLDNMTFAHNRISEPIVPNPFSGNSIGQSSSSYMPHRGFSSTPQHKNSYLNYVLVGVMVCLIIYLIMRFSDKKPFCNYGKGYSGYINEKENCILCPDNGFCENGELYCNPGYIREGDSCIEDTNLDNDIKIFVEDVLQYMAYNNGMRKCEKGSEDLLVLTWDEIKAYIRSQYPDSESVKMNNLREVFHNKFDKYFDAHEDAKIDKEKYSTFAETVPFFCWLKLELKTILGKIWGYFVQNYKKVVPASLLFLTIYIAIIKITLYFKYHKIGREAYENIVQSLKGSRGICLKILKENIKEDYSAWKIDTLWDHVNTNHF